MYFVLCVTAAFSYWTNNHLQVGPSTPSVCGGWNSQTNGLLLRRGASQRVVPGVHADTVSDISKKCIHWREIGNEQQMKKKKKKTGEWRWQFVRTWKHHATSNNSRSRCDKSRRSKHSCQTLVAFKPQTPQKMRPILTRCSFPRQPHTLPSRCRRASSSPWLTDRSVPSRPYELGCPHLWMHLPPSKPDIVSARKRQHSLTWMRIRMRKSLWMCKSQCRCKSLAGFGRALCNVAPCWSHGTGIAIEKTQQKSLNFNSLNSTHLWETSELAHVSHHASGKLGRRHNHRDRPANTARVFHIYGHRRSDIGECQPVCEGCRGCIDSRVGELECCVGQSVAKGKQRLFHNKIRNKTATTKKKDKANGQIWRHKTREPEEE